MARDPVKPLATELAPSTEVTTKDDHYALDLEALADALLQAGALEEPDLEEEQAEATQVAREDKKYSEPG